MTTTFWSIRLHGTSATPLVFNACLHAILMGGSKTFLPHWKKKPQKNQLTNQNQTNNNNNKYGCLMASLDPSGPWGESIQSLSPPIHWQQPVFWTLNNLSNKRGLVLISVFTLNTCPPCVLTLWTGGAPSRCRDAEAGPHCLELSAPYTQTPPAAALSALLLSR